PGATGSVLLRLSGAGKFYGARQVLADVSVTVHAGDKIGVVGPNGCGKSTLLRMLAGLLEPDTGRRETARDTVVGYLGQSVGFEPAEMAMSVHAFLRQAGGCRNIPAPTAAPWSSRSSSWSGAARSMSGSRRRSSGWRSSSAAIAPASRPGRPGGGPSCSRAWNGAKPR